MSTRNREQEHGVPANKDLFLGHNMGVECFNGRNINTWTATGTVKMNTDKLCNCCLFMKQKLIRSRCVTDQLTYTERKHGKYRRIKRFLY